MQINLQATLKALGIDFVVLENDVLGTSIGSDREDAQAYPLVLYQWIASDERSYIRLMITPFIERPNEGFSFELVNTVLAVNNQIPRAKFSFDEDEDLVFALDIDVEEWSQEGLLRALDILGPFADYYFAELNSLLS